MPVPLTPTELVPYRHLNPVRARLPVTVDTLRLLPSF